MQNRKWIVKDDILEKLQLPPNPANVLAGINAAASASVPEQKTKLTLFTQTTVISEEDKKTRKRRPPPSVCLDGGHEVRDHPSSPYDQDLPLCARLTIPRHGVQEYKECDLFMSDAEFAQRIPWTRNTDT